jgi:DNA-binding SARP family transcriptional activator
VAREAERRTLLQLWQTSRLVTLFGQSGVGKSGLAQAVAAELAGQRPGSVHWLDASGASGGAAVLRLLARVRRRPTQGGPAGQLPADSCPFFVLLDHLSTAAYEAVRGLLQWLVAHPDAHLLVVSRRPLGLIGERVLPLAPLGLAPDPAGLSPAVALFEHYARFARPDNALLDRAAIPAICEALDGFPAALEAAAGLLGALPEAEVVRISREEPLSLSLRGVPLRAVIGATWSDLPAEAREYLAANALWPASFSDETATQLAGGFSAAAVGPPLIQMGLLQVTRSAPRVQYRISRLLRTWMLESGPLLALERRERLAMCLENRAQSWAAGRSALNIHSEALDADELAAMRWAWRWQAGRRQGTAVRRFAGSLAGLLCHELGDPTEARELLETAALAARAERDAEYLALEARLADVEVLLGLLDSAEARLDHLPEAELAPGVRIRVLLARAALQASRGRCTAAVESRSAAIALLRDEAHSSSRRGAMACLGWALRGLSEELRRLGDPDAARLAAEECAAQFTRLDCPLGRSAALTALGVLHADRGESEEARWHAGESLALAERAGDRPGRARALQLSGRILAPQAPDEAMRLFEEATALWQSMRRPAELASALLDVATVDACPAERALSAARAARQLAREHGFAALEAAAALTLAETYRRSGRLEAAEEWACEARRASQQTDHGLIKQRCDQWSSADLSFSSSPRRPGSAAGPTLLVRLLGPFTIEGPGGFLAAARLRPREQRILARLALDRGQLVPRDELLELFWPRSPVAAAERSLRTVVSSLRSALRPILAGEAVRVISGRLDGYCLETDACAVDAELFSQAVRTARSVPGDAPPNVALTWWREAYDWYRGDLLAAFLYEDWCLTARERLRDEFLDVLFRLALAALQNESPDEALALASRMVEIDATEERAHRLLMRCYTLLERPAEALRQFERCRAALWDELAARPAPSTLELLDAIRASSALAPEDEEPPRSPLDADRALLL